MRVIRGFVNRLAHSPLVFDALRWILECGFTEHRKLLRNHFADGTERVLDCGCGTGIYADLFPADKYIGIDISPEYIASARRRCPNHQFQALDATELPYSDHFFDSAIVSGVLHHLDDPTALQVCAELCRVLKPGGRLLVWEDVPTRHSLNLVGKLVHQLDLGEYIRSSEAYQHLLTQHFEIQSTLAMRSGFMDYSVFRCCHSQLRQPAKAEDESNRLAIENVGAEPRPEGGKN